MAGKEEQAKALEKESQAPDFWNDQRQAQEKMQNLSTLRDQVSTWQGLHRRAQDALTLAEMASDDEDAGMLDELAAETDTIEKQLEKLEFQLAFSGKHDKDDALLSIHAGAGGTESQDWAEMLMRMYVRWAEASGYKAVIIDETKGEEAGLKSVTIEITGGFTYGYLKAERGVHRLVRISPFDASKRRHT
ncbi:MAG: PCRF domain-containing protein, partial [Anaerolineae bacterium]|nr:PCRF domain-containing protein [Anaerolineae bacterium]